MNPARPYALDTGALPTGAREKPDGPEWNVSVLESIVYEPALEVEQHVYPVTVREHDYTGGYVDDAIPHTTINDRLAGFYGAIFKGADHFIINEATADRPDTRDSTGLHETTHYFIPNHHMNKVSYEHMILGMSSTVHSEQPRGIATFQVRDLDIQRAYQNQRRY